MSRASDINPTASDGPMSRECEARHSRESFSRRSKAARIAAEDGRGVVVEKRGHQAVPVVVPCNQNELISLSHSAYTHTRQAAWLQQGSTAM